MERYLVLEDGTVFSGKLLVLKGKRPEKWFLQRG